MGFGRNLNDKVYMYNKQIRVCNVTNGKQINGPQFNPIDPRAIRMVGTGKQSIVAQIALRKVLEEEAFRGETVDSC